MGDDGRRLSTNDRERCGLLPGFNSEAEEVGTWPRSPAGSRQELAQRPEFTDLLQSQLRRAGSDLEVVVTQPDETANPVASVKFKSGWLAIPILGHHHPKQDVLFALAGWILLVAVGTVGVALWFAYRITRHLAIRQKKRNYNASPQRTH
jgi:hypothetical protein